ncbi:MAG: FAD-binding oxidoreductase, partial [Candidatus Kariarchaeaceae archaeon]
MLTTSRIQEFIVKELSEILEGEVYTDEVSRMLWSTDASMYQVIPTAVVTPKNEDDVIKTIKFCWDNDIPIHPRGGGAGLIGASIGEGIVIDFSTHMNEMVEINESELWFTVQPGRKLALIQKELETYDLFLPPDPASAEYCAIGGNIGTNAGGSHSVKYGLMADYTESLTVVLANGEVITTKPYKLDDAEYLELKKKDSLEANIYKELEDLYQNNQSLIIQGYPDVKYNIAGYELRNIITDGKIDLTRLFVGSEGTLGTITQIKMRVKPRIKHSVMLIAYFSDAIKMGKATYDMVKAGSSAVELMDYRLIDIIKSINTDLEDKYPKEMQYMLGIEFASNDLDEIKKAAHEAGDLLKEELAFHTEIASSKGEIENYWEIRKLALPLLGQINDNGKRIVPVIEDAAVQPENLAEYLESIIKVMDDEKVPFAMYGHAGKGLVHIRPLVDLVEKEQIETMVKVSRESFEFA